MTNHAASDWLSSLKKMIPGYGAYLDQEQRRQDDRATREFIAIRLQEAKIALDKSLRSSLEKGNLEQVQAGESLRAAIDLQQSRVRSALEGYSSWFDSKQIDANQLSKIAQLDAELVSVADRLNDSLKTQSDGQFDLLQATQLIEQFANQFQRRDELLRQ